jgi:hypothetical protein
MSENVQSEAEPRGLLQSRIVQVALVLIVVAVVLIVVGVIYFLSNRASRNKPLSVALYPGARQVSSEVLYDGHDHQQYVATDSIEQIEAFYGKQDDMKCERQYRTVQERPGQEPLKEGHLYTRCQIDHSWLGITQYTTVVIQPGIDEGGNPTGEIVIDVQRYWGS